jgi:hypothetical protein
MTAIKTDPQPVALYLDYLGEDGYAIREKEGETEARRGRALSEAEANKLLARYGVRVEAGQLYAVDGTQIEPTPGGLAAVTSYGGAPPLPDVEGKGVPPGSLGNPVTSARVDDSDGALMWMALSTLANAAMHEMKDARQVRDLMQQNKRAAKEAELGALEKQISKMKGAAWFNAATGIATAAASCVLSVSGSKWMSEGLADGLSRGLSTSLPPLGQALNKTIGPEAAANQAQIDQKRWEQQAQLFDEMIEDAKGRYDETKELFKLALKVMQEHVERETQAINSALRS